MVRFYEATYHQTDGMCLTSPISKIYNTVPFINPLIICKDGYEISINNSYIHKHSFKNKSGKLNFNLMPDIVEIHHKDRCVIPLTLPVVEELVKHHGGIDIDATINGTYKTFRQ